ncbi:DUF3087 domain-containing protein [Ectopseudomonas mendocina]|uniref:DUF3087 domain-containing protein n=1 Tax=Ectopseudomonas mendocina TaxID=300 RepID=A0ABZ2RKC4_ECTME
MTALFEIQPRSPETYRQKTRRSTLVIAVVFIALAMLLSSTAVMLFGSEGGDNFRWNLGGVLVALAATVAFVRGVLWHQPFMAEAAYGWNLKRSLMRITNVMHHVKAGVGARNESAMKLLRFYHLGVTQMHQLDGNSSALSEMVKEIDQHKERMEELNLDTEQLRLYQQWLDEVKKIPAQRS